MSHDSGEDDIDSIIDECIMDAMRYDKYVLGIPFEDQPQIKGWSKSKRERMFAIYK